MRSGCSTTSSPSSIPSASAFASPSDPNLSTPLPDLRDRYRGALLGLAAGDALGTTLEFEVPGTFSPINDMVGGGPFRLEPGQWTDDTSMALCLAESLVQCAGFDAHDQMTRYLRWWREGYLSATGQCFDIGITVRSALASFEHTDEPYAGSTDPQSAGNGSLMRLAPVVLAYRGRGTLLIDMAARSSATTHGTAACLDACRLYARLIDAALAGASKAALLEVDHSAELDPSAHDGIVSIARGSFRDRQPPQIRGTGYVVDSLEAALWALYHSSTFAEGALLAANLGDDADTTAAVYGQLAGSYYGAGGIPAHWRDKLSLADTIVAYADDLLTLSIAGATA